MGERNTPYKDGELIPLGVAAATKIEAGKMVAINASGYAVEASDAAGITVMGRAEETIDNTAGANGDLAVIVRRNKAFKFENSSANAITVAHIGSNALVEDDETVASDTTNDIPAGKILGLESDGVWVEID